MATAAEELHAPRNCNTLGCLSACRVITSSQLERKGGKGERRDDYVLALQKD